MKVRVAFSFEETQLRTIRAAIGRGGRATRNECVVFINRAVTKAIEAAPEPKPARKKATKVETWKRDACRCTEDAICAACRDRHARIATQFKHQMGRAS
jgi:hypothetical protein